MHQEPFQLHIHLILLSQHYQFILQMKKQLVSEGDKIGTPYRTPPFPSTLVSFSTNQRAGLPCSNTFTSSG